MLEKDIVNVRFEGDIAWVTICNPPVNATSTAVRAGLLKAVETVQSARVAVLCCDGKTFVAGGDMSEFDAPPQAPDLPDVVQVIEDSPVPFIAALHGTVLGGGLELAISLRMADCFAQHKIWPARGQRRLDPRCGWHATTTTFGRPSNGD